LISVPALSPLQGDATGGAMAGWRRSAAARKGLLTASLPKPEPT